MVAVAAATDRLRHGDAAPAAALLRLREAADAFRVAGRADVARAVGSAATAAREAERPRRPGAGPAPDRGPADWFLED